MRRIPDVHRWCNMSSAGGRRARVSEPSGIGPPLKIAALSAQILPRVISDPREITSPDLADIGPSVAADELLGRYRAVANRSNNLDVGPRVERHDLTLRAVRSEPYALARRPRRNDGPTDLYCQSMMPLMPSEVTGENQVGAMPSEHELDQLDAALLRDDTRVGDVFRGKRGGLTNALIAQDAGAKTHGWVTNYNGFIESVRAGKVPDGARRRQESLRAVRSFPDRHRDSFDVSTVAWPQVVLSRLAPTGGVRPATNHRDWVEPGAGGDHYQTIQLDADVYRLLNDRMRPTDRTMNDAPRRILSE